MPEKFNLSELSKNRTLIADVFSSKEKEAEVAGWVHNSRDLSKVKFIILRDSSGMIQITGIKGKTPEKIFKDMEKIPRESVIYVKGFEQGEIHNFAGLFRDDSNHGNKRKDTRENIQGHGKNSERIGDLCKGKNS